MSGSGQGKSAKDERNERLKQALRANLRRRKQQSKQKRPKDQPARPKPD